MSEKKDVLVRKAVEALKRSEPIGDRVIASITIFNKARVLSNDPNLDAIREIRRI